MAGSFVDIFDPQLKVLNDVKLPAGASGLYRDVTEIFKNGRDPCVLHATHRLMDQQYNKGTLRMTIKGPAGTPAVVRVFTGDKDCRNIRAWDTKQNQLNVDFHGDKNTCLLKFPNDPQGETVEIQFFEYMGD